MPPALGFEVGGQRNRAGTHRFPLHGQGRHRLGEPLERQVAHRRERCPAPAGREPAAQLGDEDLPSVCLGAQPGRLHHRCPEIVPLFAGDLADAHPDPDGESPAGSRRLWREIDCCMATAHASAALGLVTPP